MQSTKRLFMLGIMVGSLSLAACNSTHKDSSANNEIKAQLASLADLRILVPCGDHFNQNTECHWDKSLLQTQDPRWKLKQEITRVFPGKSDQLYDVTLHIRGVVEPKNYVGGTVQFDHFQTDGEPVKNDYNVYSLNVSNPAATYVVNRNLEKVGHYTFAIDYQVTIPIRGGATLIMGSYDSNDVAIANHEQNVISSIQNLAQPYDGQFFDIEVVSIKPNSLNKLN